MVSSADRRSSSHPQRLIDLNKIKSTLTHHKLLWVTPTVLFTLLGFLHILTKKNDWRATQTLIVRDEAIGEMGFGNSGPLGRFEDKDALKRFLETVVQVSQNREVLRAALAQVGPTKPKQRGTFPSDDDVEAFRTDVIVSAPKGTEFGTSEVIHLSVTAHEKGRAVKMAMAMCDELENRMRVIRNEYAQSIMAELQEKKQLAERDLETSTQQLSQLEANIGEDLGEMRSLAEGMGGESILQNQLSQIKGELRQLDSQQDAQRELLSLLQKFSNDSEAILATPNRLLESQPGLRRLKDGLVDAQLRTARLRGGLTEAHPRVQSALQNERNVEAQLLGEVENAIIAIRAEISLGNRLVESLNVKLANVQQRLDGLASQRTRYVNLTAEVNQKREQVRLAAASLAEARGRQEASKTSSLITRVDSPVTGAKPEGPKRIVLLFGSMIAGLTIGLSLVYLLAPWQEARRGRRKTDRIGRRVTDQTGPRTAHDDRRQFADAPIPPMAPETPTVILEFGDGTSATHPTSQTPG